MGLRGITGQSGLSRLSSGLRQTQAPLLQASGLQAGTTRNAGGPLISNALRDNTQLLTRAMDRFGDRSQRLQSLNAALETVRSLLGDLRSTVEAALQQRGNLDYDLGAAQQEVDSSVASIEAELANARMTPSAPTDSETSTTGETPSRVSKLYVSGVDNTAPSEASYRITGGSGTALLRLSPGRHLTEEVVAEINKLSNQTGVVARVETDLNREGTTTFSLTNLDPTAERLEFRAEETMEEDLSEFSGDIESYWDNKAYFDEDPSRSVTLREDLNGDGQFTNGVLVRRYSVPIAPTTASPQDDLRGRLQNLTTGRPLELAGDNPEAGLRQIDAAIGSVDQRLAATRRELDRSTAPSFAPDGGVSSLLDSLRETLMSQVRQAVQSQSRRLASDGLLRLLR